MFDNIQIQYERKINRWEIPQIKNRMKKTSHQVKIVRVNEWTYHNNLYKIKVMVFFCSLLFASNSECFPILTYFGRGFSKKKILISVV